MGRPVAVRVTHRTARGLWALFAVECGKHAIAKQNRNYYLSHICERSRNLRDLQPALALLNLIPFVYRASPPLTHHFLLYPFSLHT